MLKEKIENRGLLVLRSRERLNKAELEDRELNSAEKKEHDRDLAEIEKLSIEIDKIQEEAGISDLDQATLDRIKGDGYSGSRFNKDIKFYSLADVIEERKNLNKRLEKPLSIGNCVKAICTGDWSKCSKEERAGIGTGDQGIWLIQQEMGKELILSALEKAQVMAAGARHVPMTQHELLIPKITKYPDAQFTAENKAWEGDPQAINFSGVVLTARTLASFVTLSIELAEDGYRVEDYISMAMSKAVANAIDKACLSGSGKNNQPTGVINQKDILEEDAENVNLTNFDHFSNAFYKVEKCNITPAGLILPSSVLASLDLLKNKDDDPLKPPESWGKVKKFSSNQLINNCVVAAWNYLLIGMRATARLEVTRVAGDAWEKMQLKLRIYTRFDCGLGLSEAFCNIKNIGEIIS